MKIENIHINGAFMAALLALTTVTSSFSQAATINIELFDKNGKAITELVDGNIVSLKATLPQPVMQDMTVEFVSPGLDLPLGTCSIPAEKSSCQTAPAPSLGWYWNPGGVGQPDRIITALAGREPLPGSLTVKVNPRPVVMVHGFISSWEAWQNYLGDSGYLSGIGVPGFAVGDGRAKGVLNTGSIDAPTTRTNTIAQNAAILRDYIKDVQSQTGAEKVDLLVHSMGGMISRYYIDRLMPENDVAQLLILGTPMAGTDCANLPASLGMYLPATLEIQPGYMANVFNQQVFHRHGIPFYALAGTEIIEAIQSPCTSVPSDIAVSLESLNAIPLDSTEMSLLHTDLNTSNKVFMEFVQPHLQTPPGGFAAQPDPQPGSISQAPLQFSRVYTGQVKPGESETVVINIDPNVTVASFGLYDPSLSLSVNVKGASGKTIELDAQKNGLIQIDDPETMIYLGYGFKQPKPGKWEVTLIPGEKTPASGTSFAITARFEGGASLQAATDVILPELGQPVTLTASLGVSGKEVEVTQAEAQIRNPDGDVEMVTLDQTAGVYQAVFTPTKQGIYGIEVYMLGKTGDGVLIDRAAFLTVEAQPPAGISPLGWAVFCGIGLFLVGVGILFMSRLIRANRRKNGFTP